MCHLMREIIVGIAVISTVVIISLFPLRIGAEYALQMYNTHPFMHVGYLYVMTKVRISFGRY
jgi:hypothetical protein